MAQPGDIMSFSALDDVNMDTQIISRPSTRWCRCSLAKQVHITLG